MKTLKLEHLAREAGVSIATVSRTLNGSHAISLPVREKILALARQNGYFSERRKYRVIAIIISFLRNLHANYILAELQQLALENGFLLEMILPEQLHLLRGRVFYGAIALDSDPGIVAFWQQEMICPLIRIDNESFPMDQIFSICNDENQAMEMAFNLFQSYGHRNIGMLLCCEDCNSFWNRARCHAFIDQSARHGQPVPALKTASDRAGMDQAIAELLNQGITALIYLCTPDIQRLDHFLAQHAIQVPGDLSLIAWEMLGMHPLYCNDITVLRHDHHAFVVQALRILEACNQKKEVPEHRLLEYICSHGSSVGPVPNHPPRLAPL